MSWSDWLGPDDWTLIKMLLAVGIIWALLFGSAILFVAYGPL